jgi:Flp pilus assembly protein TadG
MTILNHRKGQSMVEFAMVLPILVLFIGGIFELGRAFFAFIAITNAAREGARVITFWPGKTTGNDVVLAINTEIGNSPMVTIGNIASRSIECGTGGVDYVPIAINSSPLVCQSERPIRVTVTYNFRLVMQLFFPNPITLQRSAEMMMP